MVKKRKSIFFVLFVSMMLISIYMCSANEPFKNEMLFSDTKETDWFFDDVNYVSNKGLMNGTEEKVFSPYEKMTRGMLVTVLWRIDGESKETGKIFSDVSESAYYHDAVAWASNHQIVNGYDETTFGADDATTREQMIAILYRYAEYKKYDVTQKSSLDKYEDVNLISDYAMEALAWGYANEIISGTSETTLSPKDLVQRCQVAAILRRFCTKYVDVESPQQPEKTPEPGKATERPVLSGGNSGGGSSSSGSSSGTSGSDNTATSTPNTDEEAPESKSAKITVDSIEAKPGETVQLKAVIKNNPGILGMTLTASYDETYCTLESVESGDAFDGVLDFITSKTLNSGTRFVWDGIDITDDQIKDGTVVVMTFAIKKEAPECNIPITLQCYENDAVDRNLKVIPLQIESGVIKVK